MTRSVYFSNHFILVPTYKSYGFYAFLIKYEFTKQKSAGNLEVWRRRRVGQKPALLLLVPLIHPGLLRHRPDLGHLDGQVPVQLLHLPLVRFSAAVPAAPAAVPAVPAARSFVVNVVILIPTDVVVRVFSLLPDVTTAFALLLVPVAGFVIWDETFASSTSSTYTTGCSK